MDAAPAYQCARLKAVALDCVNLCAAIVVVTACVVCSGGLAGVDRSLAAHKFLVNQLLALKAAGYNVLYAPHPLSVNHQKHRDKCRTLKAKGIAIAEADVYPSKLPLWAVADVIVGATGGAFHGAAFFPEKPLVLFRPSTYMTNRMCAHSAWWPHRHDLLMGDKEAVVFTEHKPNLVQAVATALRRNRASEHMTEAREKYFERWHGQVDGYEDYRFAICLLQDIMARGSDTRIVRQRFEQQLQRLRQVYMSLPRYRGRRLVEPSREACALILPGACLYQSSQVAELWNLHS